MKTKADVVFILGTNAELIKCAPLMKELKKQKRDYYFIHTGQHANYSKQCKNLGVKIPDAVLSGGREIKGRINSGSIKWTFRTISEVKDRLSEIRPEYVIYHGDTISSVTASLGASRLLNGKRKTWKSVHLEAGLRSGSLKEPFPEEISRIICDRLSDVLLTVSERTTENLKKYKKKKVFNAGNTILDTLNARPDKNPNNAKENYALTSIHRYENLKSKDRMRKIIGIIKLAGVKIVWPMHENTKVSLIKHGMMKDVQEIKNIEIMPLIDYSDFLKYLANCKYVLTDGGTVQEECLIFKKPCILLRKKTERQEGLKTGIQFLTRLNPERSKKIIKKIEGDKLAIRDFKNPYGEKGVSGKIVKILNNLNGRRTRFRG